MEWCMQTVFILTLNSIAQLSKLRKDWEVANGIEYQLYRRHISVWFGLFLSTVNQSNPKPKQQRHLLWSTLLRLLFRISQSESICDGLWSSLPLCLHSLSIFPGLHWIMNNWWAIARLTYTILHNAAWCYATAEYTLPHIMLHNTT